MGRKEAKKLLKHGCMVMSFWFVCACSFRMVLKNRLIKKVKQSRKANENKGRIAFVNNEAPMETVRLE